MKRIMVLFLGIMFVLEVFIIGGVSASSSGGIGGVSFFISNSSFANGVIRNLGNGGSLNFNIGNQTHSLTVNNISNESIRITIQSFPQSFIMEVGDILDVDVNNDGIKDLEVSYLKYYTSLVSLRIKSIYLPYEVPVAKNETVDESPYGIGNDISVVSENNNSLFFMILSVIVFLVLITISFRIYGKK